MRMRRYDLRRAPLVQPGRSLPALVVAVILLLASPAAASWLHASGDPARTGYVDGPAPRLSDLAFTLELPVPDGGDEVPVHPPLIHGRSAFVVTSADVQPGTVTKTDGSGVESLVHRIDLDTGDVVQLARVWTRQTGAFEVLGRGVHLVSDGIDLYLVHLGEVWRIPAESGGEAERVADLATASLTGDPGTTTPRPECGAPAIADGVLYAACLRRHVDTASATAYAVAFELASREVLWTWVMERDGIGPSSTGLDPAHRAFRGSTIPKDGTRIVGTTVVDRHVMVTLYQDHTFNTFDGMHASVVFLDRRTGEDLWLAGDYAPVVLALETPGGQADGFNIPPLAAADAEAAYYRFDMLFRIPFDDLRLGGDSWVDTSGGRDMQANRGGGIALGPDGVYGTSRWALTKASREMEPQWTRPLPGGLEWTTGGVVLYEDRFVGVTREGAARHLFAIATVDGTPDEPHAIGAPASIAGAPGLLLALDRTGRLAVFGQTNASIQPVIAASTDAPSPGDLVTVDLSGTAPGLAGPATRYRADWGDGTVTDWQTSPVFEHRYSQPTDHVASFTAANDEQSTTVTKTFFVGRPATDLTLIQEWFSRDRQDTTWGIIGLLVTFIGAAIAIARVRRRRARFQKEMETLERMWPEVRDDARAAEAMLTERRAHVRGLVADGRLEEGHGSLLMARIDELHHGMRLGMVDERLGFLPYGMVEHLRSILSDNRVTAWEHKHFIDALEADTFLQPDQKAQVRRLVDEWFERDAGAA